MMKLMGIRLSLIWLVMAVAATAQILPPASPVLDTDGHPLQRGVEYFIRTAGVLESQSGPFITLIDHEKSHAACPKFVVEGQTSSSELPVTFAPVDENDQVVRLRKNFKATFSKTAKCDGSTTWKVGKREAASLKRLIETGDGGWFGNYFLIEKFEWIGAKNNVYNLVYCPTELCPTCKFECGKFEPLVSATGEKFISLGSTDTTAAIAVQFQRVFYT